MGISANQARLLTLTARQHDLELRAQRISAHKMFLTMQSQAEALKYANALQAYHGGKVASRTPIWSEATTRTESQTFTFDNAYFQKFQSSKVSIFFRNGNDDRYLSEGANALDLLAAGYQVWRRTDVTPVSTPAPQSGNNNDLANLLYEVIQERQLNKNGSTSDWTFGNGLGYVKEGNEYQLTVVANQVLTGNNEPDESLVTLGDQVVTFAYAASVAPQFASNVLANNRISPIITEAQLSTYASQHGIDLASILAAAEQEGSQGSSNDEVQEPVYEYEQLPAFTFQGQTVEYNAPSVTIEYTVNVPAQIIGYEENDDAEVDFDFEAAKTEYEVNMAALSNDEKILDMELTQINTEHKAVKTEYDAVKSLVSDNTEKSFNVFG